MSPFAAGEFHSASAVRFRVAVRNGILTRERAVLPWRRAARRFLSGAWPALFFILLICIVAPRFLPYAWQASLSRLLTSASLSYYLLLLSPALLLGGFALLRLVHRELTARNTPLSIT